jgi:DNA topoisomerase III
MKLYLCEKPSQAADIAPHVGARRRGDGFFEGDVGGQRVVVTFAVGHLLELVYPDAYKPELKQWSLESLPFVPGHSEWKMEAKSGTLKQFNVVKGLLKQATSVVIATDADREGEVIAREVMDYCGYRGPAQRLWITALDDASIKKALGKLLPDSKTIGMAYAGMGRGRADWAMGLNLTRALTVAFGAGGKSNTLNCGRVQTPTMALVVRRERAIVNFVATPYFELAAKFDVSGTVVPMRWQMPAALKAQQTPYEGTLDSDGRVVRRAVIAAVAARVQGRTGRVSGVTQSAQAQVAPLLYALSTLQVDCSKRFGMKPAKTLEIAQALYEKHKATSYPRTDCEYLPESMAAEVPAVLSALGGIGDLAVCAADLSAILTQVLLTQPSVKRSRVFNDKKVTAHHAIIPTMKLGVSMAALSPAERQVYDLIVRRYLAQFLGYYEYQQTDVTVVCEGETFTARGAVPTQLGWKLCYPTPVKSINTTSNAVADDSVGGNGDAGGEGKDDKGGKDELVHLPAMREGMQAHNRDASVRDCKTKPPLRYTEGTLLAAMDAVDKEIDDPRFKAVMKNKEKAGIGTDATRANIIEGLGNNGFIEPCPTAKKYISPTAKANEFIALLEQVAPTVVDPVLTAMWEEMLTQVQDGVLTLEQFENAVTTWLSKVVADIKVKAKEGFKIAAAPEKAVRGKVAYSGPATRTAANSAASRTTAAAAPHAAGQSCPKCSKTKLVLKPSTKYPGKYLLCCTSRECGHYEWPKG